MRDLEVVTVPKELYYHEAAYVRGLEAKNEQLQARLNALQIAFQDNEAFRRVFAELENTL